MSRKKKTPDIINVFKEDFNVTFIYKPTMATGDTWYYLFLDDSLRIRLKVFGSVVVIDEAIPLSMKYIAPMYSTLMDTLIKQDKFTILISILGDTSGLGAECLKANAAIVEDERFITVPEEYYKRIVDYYKGDMTKYGFYLLAIKDEEHESSQEKKEVAKFIDEIDLSEEVDMGPPINIGVKPLMIRLFELISTWFPSAVTDDRNNSQDTTFDIGDIKFRVRINQTDTEVRITNIVLAPEYRYTDLVKLFTKFVDFLDECPDIYVEVESSVVNQVCEFLLFQQQNRILGNRAYYNVIGAYKITTGAVK